MDKKRSATLKERRKQNMDMINELSTKKEILIKQVFSNFKVSENNNSLV